MPPRKPKSRYRGSAGMQSPPRIGKAEYAKRLARALERHVEALQSIQRWHTIPSKHRASPTHYVIDKSKWKEWEDHAREAKRIQRKLRERFGEEVIRRHLESRKNATIEFRDFVNRELRDLERDIPETGETIPKWIVKLEARRHPVQASRLLTEVEKNANLLYLVRCRRRMEKADAQMVWENLPF